MTMNPAAPPAADRSILFLISNLGLGGAERQLVYLALGLKARGWDVEIANMTPLLDPSFEAALRGAGIPIHTLQTGMDARLGALFVAVRALVRLVRRTRPGVLVGFMPHGALLARLVGRLTRVPRVVSSLRNMKSTHKWHDWLLALTRGLDDALVTNSAVAAGEQWRAGVTTPAKSVVIANGFDLGRVRAKPTAPGAEPAAPFTWINVAVFRTEKDHATLLAAAKRLSGERSFRLVLAGEGPVLEGSRAYCAELGLQGTVEFLGWRSEIADLLTQADAFVLSSLWEGLPNVLIEAHAAGLPVVTTRVGGCPEIVQDGVSGLLVPPGSPDQLAAAMRRIMDLSVGERQAMGAAGRAHVLSSFSMDQMVCRWERVLLDGIPQAAEAVS